MFVKASTKSPTIAKALVYCTTKFITAVKNFMIQAPELGCSARPLNIITFRIIIISGN